MNVQEQERSERQEVSESGRGPTRKVRPALLLGLAAGMIVISVLTYIAAHVFLKPMLLRLAAHNGLRSIVGSVDNGGVPGTFGLRLAPNSSALDIWWDPLSPSIQSAQAGKLVVSDGPLNREVQLSREQLQNGRLIYGRPVSGEFTLRLEVMDSKSHGFAESLRVTGGSFAGLSVPYRQQASTQPEVAPSPPLNHRILDTAERRRLRPPLGDAHDVVKGHEAFAQQTAREPDSHGLVSHPSVSASGAMPSKASGVGTGGRSVTEIQSAQSLAKTAVKSSLDPVRPTSQIPIPLLTHPYAATLQVTSIPKLLTPATVLSPYYPDIHPGSGPPLETNLFISVTVKISESGEVTSAALTRPDMSTSPYYADEAVKAARLWRFSPATVSGKSVASEMEVQFHFSPVP